MGSNWLDVENRYLAYLRVKRLKDYNNFRIWASELGLCALKVVYRLQGVMSSDIEDKGLLAMAEGEMHEKELQEVFNKTGIKVLATQYPIRFSLGDWGLAIPISGRADFVIELDGRRYVVEFKTTRKFSFNRQVSEGINSHYVIQLAPYLIKLGVDGLILLKNRDDGNFLEFKVSFYDALRWWFGYILPKVKLIADMYFTGRLLHPDEVEKFGWECKYCKYREHCQEVSKDASVDW